MRLERTEEDRPVLRWSGKPLAVREAEQSRLERRARKQWIAAAAKRERHCMRQFLTHLDEIFVEWGEA